MEYKMTNEEIISKGIDFCKQLNDMVDKAEDQVTDKDIWGQLRQAMDNMNQEGL